MNRNMVAVVGVEFEENYVRPCHILDKSKLTSVYVTFVSYNSSRMWWLAEKFVSRSVCICCVLCFYVACSLARSQRSQRSVHSISMSVCVCLCTVHTALPHDVFILIFRVTVWCIRCRQKVRQSKTGLIAFSLFAKCV